MVMVVVVRERERERERDRETERQRGRYTYLGDGGVDERPYSPLIYLSFTSHSPPPYLGDGGVHQRRHPANAVAKRIVKTHV